MKIVHADLNPQKAPLQEPTGHGYLLLAAESDRRPMFLPPSATRRKLIKQMHAAAVILRQQPAVLRADVFRGFAHLVFGIDHRLIRRAAADGRLDPARYDLVLLIETAGTSAATELRDQPAYQALLSSAGSRSRRTFELAGRNARNMGEVSTDTDGVFLFNFFYADDPAELIPVWEYTAGWWRIHTGLDNSRVIEPIDGERTDYGIINHCRWDRLTDVVPKMIFDRTFQKFVLGNFAANDISAQPTLYRRA